MENKLVLNKGTLPGAYRDAEVGIVQQQQARRRRCVDTTDGTSFRKSIRSFIDSVYL